MRTVIAIAALLIIVLLPISAFAWSLVCDPQVDVMTYDVEVNGVVVATNHPAEANGSIDYNVDSLGPGPVSFRLRAKTVSGWGSDWSLPFDASKPGSPGNARIVKDAGD